MSELRCSGSRKYYLRYTIVFLLLTGISLSWFLVRKKAFIWSQDGIVQHYNALAYYGNYLRGIFSTLWKEHRLVVPAYDFSIGYGADVLATLNYYVIGDPLNLLSVFVPARYTEYLFETLVIIRMYLAGLTFSVFARESIRDYLCEYPDTARQSVFDDAVLLGSVTYLFSEYVLYFFCRHPFFLTPMICLPLLLLGVDRVYRGKRGALYIAAIALSALCNFYFFYMLGILTVIYAVFRFFSFHSFSIGKIGGYLFRFCVFTLLGIGIAAVVLCPSVMSVVGAERFQEGMYVPLFYELKYYVRLFSGFISMDSPGFQTLLGYPAAAFLAVILLFEQKKRYLLKGGFLLLTVFLLIPFFGHIFNGFSYVTNRWTFAYTMLAAWITVRMYPLLIQELSVRTKRTLFLFAGLEILACLAGIAAKYFAHREMGLAPMTLNLLALLVLTGLFVFVPAERKSALPFGFLVGAITVGCVACNAFDIRTRENTASVFPDAGTVQSSLADPPSVFLKGYENDGVPWRYGEKKTGEKLNSALQTGMYGTSFYFSVANPYIAEFRSSLYMNELLDRSYRGMDGRGILEMLSGVKYYVAPEGGKAPAGYRASEEFSHNGVNYVVYVREEETTQPFLLGYDRVISREAFERLSVEQKQQTLLEAMVCEEDEELPDFIERDAAETPDTPLCPTKITCKKNCTLKDGAFHVKKAGGKVVLESATDQTGEVCVVAEGLEFEKKTSGNRILSDSIDKDMDKVKIKIIQGDTRSRIQISGEKGRQSSSGRENFVCNLGTQPAGKKEITLKFPAAGTYRFTDLRISLQPTAGIAKKAAKWSEGIDGTLSVDGDRVTGDLTLARDRLVCLAIPYDRGWSLEVDGEPERIVRGNIMYCAVPLEAGEHTVRMQYKNPYVRPGGVVSALSMLAFVIYLWKSGRKGEV